MALRWTGSSKPEIARCFGGKHLVGLMGASGAHRGDHACGGTVDEWLKN